MSSSTTSTGSTSAPGTGPASVSASVSVPSSAPDEYVVVVPRGFELVAIDAIRSSIAIAADEGGSEGRGGGRRGDNDGEGRGGGEGGYTCKVGMLFHNDETDTPEAKSDLLRRLREQREDAERHQRNRRMRPRKGSGGDGGAGNGENTRKNDKTGDDGVGAGSGTKKPRREEGEGGGTTKASPAKKVTGTSNGAVDLPNVGTVRHPRNGSETSVGYHRRRRRQSPTTSSESECEVDIVTSNPGRDTGFDLLHLKTDAPADVVAHNVRAAGCGPLLALVVHNGDPFPCTREDVPQETMMRRRLTHVQGWDEARMILESVIGNGDGRNTAVVDGYRRALDLWARHARLWRRRWGDECFSQGNKGKARGTRCGSSGSVAGANGDGPYAPSRGENRSCGDQNEDFFLEDLEAKIRGEVPLTFRGSCVRANSSKFEYRRTDVMGAVGSSVPVGSLSGSPLLPPTKAMTPSDVEGKPPPETTKWTVDLNNYDFEVVGFVTRCGRVALCISLIPYNHLGANSFSGSNLPTDVSPPFVVGGISNIVRLKPCIASMLLHVADLDEGDLVVDPCGGIGTVTVEAELMPRRRLVGIGGDVVTELAPIAARYGREAGRYRKRMNIDRNEDTNGGRSDEVDGCGASDFISWDATLLPLRDGCVDAVVSDLPFGQRCMSHSGLLGFLPPLVDEVARVLRPSGGRVVFLTGGTYRLVVDALARAGDEKKFFEIPPQSVFPVNIGGLSAWVIVAVRSSVVTSRQPTPSHLEKVRRMTASRERNARCEEARAMAARDDDDGDADGRRQQRRLQR